MSKCEKYRNLLANPFAVSTISLNFLKQQNAYTVIALHATRISPEPRLDASN